MRVSKLRNLIRNEQGLTLIEVLGAMAVLSILVMSFVALSQYTGSAVVKADRQSDAMVIAQQKLNELRTTILATTPMPSVTDLTAGTLNSPDPTYSIYYTITSIETPPDLPDDWASFNKVSVQGMVLLSDNGTKVSRVLTVSVVWEGL
jgi:prepilin-type N-terminal cleavage/methylation domain-containing protein